MDSLIFTIKFRKHSGRGTPHFTDRVLKRSVILNLLMWVEAINEQNEVHAMMYPLTAAFISVKTKTQMLQHIPTHLTPAACFNAGDLKRTKVSFLLPQRQHAKADGPDLLPVSGHADERPGKPAGHGRGLQRQTTQVPAASVSMEGYCVINVGGSYKNPFNKHEKEENCFK